MVIACLARKKNEYVTFCVDHRKSYEVTRKNPHPMPRINNALDAVQKLDLFSIELTSPYR